MRFGRSRVQDRAEVSDVETVIEEPPAAIDEITGGLKAAGLAAKG